MGRPPTCSCGSCKKCKQREYMRAWYQAKTPEERRKWVSRRDPEIVRKNDQKRGQTERRKAWNRAYRPVKAAREQEKYKARTAVGNALRDGKLQREPCVQCGNPRSEAHHEDYSRPLDVTWLCRRDHRALHEARKVA